MFSSLCIDAFLPRGKKSRIMYKNTRGRGKRHKMDKQMWDKNKRHSRQRKAKKLRRHLFQYLSFLDMHIGHRKVLKWISAKKNSYTQLLCHQIISKNSNYLCLWQWEAIIHNGPLFSPAPFHSFLDWRNEINIHTIITLTENGNRWTFFVVLVPAEAQIRKMDLFISLPPFIFLQEVHKVTNTRIQQRWRNLALLTL